MLVLAKLTVFSQTTSDSLKCFTYSEARKIIRDLRQLPIKDSIIVRQDSLIVNLYNLDSVRVDRIEDYKQEVTEITKDKDKAVKRLRTTKRITFTLCIAVIIESFILLLK